jgi:hypothetical protein
LGRSFFGVARNRDLAFIAIAVGELHGDSFFEAAPPRRFRRSGLPLASGSHLDKSDPSLTLKLRSVLPVMPVSQKASENDDNIIYTLVSFATKQSRARAGSKKGQLRYGEFRKFVESFFLGQCRMSRFHFLMSEG